MQNEFDFTELERLVGLVVRERWSNNPKSRKIHDRVGILCGYLHGPSWEAEQRYKQKQILQETQDYVINEIFEECCDRGHYLKYDKTKGKLITWVLNRVYWSLLNLLRRHKPRPLGRKNKSILDLYDPRNDSFRISFSDREELNLLPGSLDNPEDLLAAKQLYLLAGNHFSKVDFEVMAGRRITDVVKEKRWNYECYKKQLQRRRESFKAVLFTHGYEYT